MVLEVLNMIQGLGERLQELRTSQNLSQKEVARILDVYYSVISNYESGERTPSLEKLVALARLYHCSTDYLLGFDSKHETTSINISMLSAEQKRLLQKFLYSLS